MLPILSAVAALAAIVNTLFWWVGTRRLVGRLRWRPPGTGDQVGSRHPAETFDPAARLPRATVLVAARNEADNLRRYVPLLVAQDYPALEVVVVDDASADASADVLRVLAAAEPRLRALRVDEKTRPGKKEALALGLERTDAPWVLATDADCAPASPQWARRMLYSCGPDTEFVLGYGPLRRGPGALNRWIRFETTYTAIQYLSAALLGRPYMGVGRNLLYARAAYERVGGFAAHAHLAGGDDDLLVSAAATRANTAVCVDEAAWVYSAAKGSWAAYLRQKRRHLSVSVAYRPLDQAWLAALALSHVALYAALGGLVLIGAHEAAALLYALRAINVWPRWVRLAQGLGQADLAWWWPLLDAGAAVYYAAAPLLLVWGGSGRRADW